MTNEIMTNEVDNETVECEETGTGLSTGAAMAIGAGITFLIGAGIKFARKAAERWVAKKQSEPAAVEGPTEEAVKEVAEN
jgi:hypothetical protein